MIFSKITFPNLLRGSDFLCFVFMNYKRAREKNIKHGTNTTFNKEIVGIALTTIVLKREKIN